ncbi:hypothetical protein N9241_01575 [bacterium]|nr:hypothetical protein [bacterium]
MNRALVSFGVATLWVGMLLYLSRVAIHSAELWVFIIVAILSAAPALMSALYSQTIGLIHRASKFNTTGHLKQFTVRRAFFTIAITIYTITMSFLTVLWLSSLSTRETLLVLVSLVVLFSVHIINLKWAKSEMAGYHINLTALRWSRLVASLSMMLVLISVSALFDGSSELEPLAMRLDGIAEQAIDTHKSVLVQVAAKASSHIQEIRSYALGHSRVVSPFYLVATLLGSFALFYNFSFIVSGFLISRTEYRRVFSPLESNKDPAPVALSSIIFTSTLVTVIAFMLITSISHLEMAARANVATTGVVVKAERRLVSFAEEIDSVLYKTGTHRKIAEAKLDALQKEAESIAAIKNQGRQAFEAMRQNVDLYLDIYYSLPAEYLRVVGALSGGLEDSISNDLTAILMDSEAVESLDAILMDELEKQPEIWDVYREQVSIILSGNRIDDPDGKVIVVSKSATDPLGGPPESAVLIGFNQRVGAAGVGAVGGLIAAKVVSKVAAKGAIKFAAKAVAKLGASKLAGGAAVAAVGAAIGSFVPVAGTLVGSAIGFTAGMILGVSIDAALLQLEENYSRAEFKQQIMEAIDEQEAEFDAMFEV